jgi:hypothetical protein
MIKIHCIWYSRSRYHTQDHTHHRRTRNFLPIRGEPYRRRPHNPSLNHAAPFFHGPCLAFHAGADYDAPASEARLRSITNGAGGGIHRVDLQDPPVARRYVMGSFHGWLANADEKSDLLLVNPVTRAPLKAKPRLSKWDDAQRWLSSSLAPDDDRRWSSCADDRTLLPSASQRGRQSWEAQPHDGKMETKRVDAVLAYGQQRCLSLRDVGTEMTPGGSKEPHHQVLPALFVFSSHPTMAAPLHDMCSTKCLPGSCVPCTMSFRLFEHKSCQECLFGFSVLEGFFSH